MAVKVKVTADTDQANKAIKASQDQAATGYKKLSALADEGLKAEKLKQAFEGFKKAAELVSPELDKVSAGLGKNIKSSFEFAESGAKIGALWGPVGIVVGGAIGALAGYFISAQRNAAELTKKIIELKKEGALTLQKIHELDEFSMDNAIGEIEKLRAKIWEGGQTADVARGLLRGLLNESSDKLAESFDKAALAADKAKEATIAILKPVELTADQAKEVINEQAANIRTAKAQIQSEAKNIRDALVGGYANEDILKAQEKLLKTLKENIAGYTKVQVDAAGALKKALDKEVADEEAAEAKKLENFHKAQEKRATMLATDNKKLALISQAVIDDYEREQKAIEDLTKAEQTWHVETKQLIFDVNIAKQKASEMTREALRKETEERAANLAHQQEELKAAFDSAQQGFQSVLQPFADVASQVFGKIQENIEAGKRPLDSFKAAFKGAVGDVLKSLGKQWGAQALSELAAGFAALALGPIGGVSAGSHFTAAALYGTAAVAAGVGGAALSKSAGGSTSSSAPGPSSGSGSSNPSLGKTSSGNGSGGTVIVNLSGNMFLEGNDRDISRAGAIIGNAIGVSRTASFLDTGQRRAA